MRALEPMLVRYAKERSPGERFGDFVIRAGYVSPTTAGNRFHADVTPNSTPAQLTPQKNVI
jgi:sulfite reductase (NADPH) hemoprotein beta-component